jgi:hypothetical protein
MKWLRRRDEQEVDEEISTHLEFAVEDYRRRGLSEEEARRRAALDFGGVQQAKEARRDARRFAEAEILWQDIRYGLRSLRRDGGFTAMAVAILALGIGATTAVFSIVDSVLLRPLAYGHADRLIALQEVVPQFSHIAPAFPVNGRHFVEWQRHARTLEAVALLDGTELNLTGLGEPERVNGTRTSTNLFDVLGVRAQLGRTFTPEDTAHPAVVISHGLWQRKFGGVPDVVGRSLSLNGVSHRVVGDFPVVLGRGTHPYRFRWAEPRHRVIFSSHDRADHNRAR